MMKKYALSIAFLFLIINILCARNSLTFYVSESNGNNANNGLSPQTAWKTIEKVNSGSFIAGDSILFKTGDTFTGRLILEVKGSKEAPIVFSSYGNMDHPIFDGDGNLSSILLKDCSYIKLTNLKIKNDNEISKPGVSTKTRYGIYLERTEVCTDISFLNISFTDIYPTEQITDDDQTGINGSAIANQGSWNDGDPTFINVLVDNCYFTKTARHALSLGSMQNLTITNCLFEHVGGAGIVIINSEDVLIENNVTQHTGSGISGRMAARGSGLWCIRSEGVVAQYNKFMYARGVKDSYGMHIDIGNRDIVYQYNLSVGNEGGFVEVLGGNVNVGYRYNVSIADGWRKRGDSDGRVFWIGNWSGDWHNPIGSDSIFVYNNSIYIPDTIQPSIRIEKHTKNTMFYNNIVYASLGFGDVIIENESNFNLFDYNIWYGAIRSVDQNSNVYRGINALTVDPQYSDRVVTTPEGFLLRQTSPAINKGKIIYNPDKKWRYDYYINAPLSDFFGNPVELTNKPNIGADNKYNSDVSVPTILQSNWKLFPNPVLAGQKLNLVLPVDLQTNKLFVRINDFSGKTIRHYSFEEGNKIEIQTGNLIKGLYLLVIENGKDMFQEKIIVL